jgi:hypothetical protein
MHLTHPTPPDFSLPSRASSPRFRASPELCEASHARNIESSVILWYIVKEALPQRHKGTKVSETT